LGLKSRVQLGPTPLRSRTSSFSLSEFRVERLGSRVWGLGVGAYPFRPVPLEFQRCFFPGLSEGVYRGTSPTRKPTEGREGCYRGVFQRCFLPGLFEAPAALCAGCQVGVDFLGFRGLWFEFWGFGFGSWCSGLRGLRGLGFGVWSLGFGIRV
jgi:hypothetical protein